MHIFILVITLICSFVVWSNIQDRDERKMRYRMYVLHYWYIPFVFFLIFEGGAWMIANL